MHENDIPYEQITKEAVNQYPIIESLFVARGAEVTAGEYARKDGIMAGVFTSRPFSDDEKARFTNWLKIRLNTEDVTLYEFVARHEKKSSEEER